MIHKNIVLITYTEVHAFNTERLSNTTRFRIDQIFYDEYQQHRSSSHLLASSHDWKEDDLRMTYTVSHGASRWLTCTRKRGNEFPSHVVSLSMLFLSPGRGLTGWCPTDWQACWQGCRRKETSVPLNVYSSSHLHIFTNDNNNLHSIISSVDNDSSTYPYQTKLPNCHRRFHTPSHQHSIAQPSDTIKYKKKKW